MSRQVQIIRGTTEQNDNFTGATGALTYDTDTKGLRVHDGSTQGGFEVPTAAMADYVIYWDSANATDHSHAKPGVQTPINNGWYRYYKSGWVEQGGRLAATGNYITFWLPIKMLNDTYWGQAQCSIPSGNTSNQANFSLTNRTTTNCRVYGQVAGHNIDWQIKGYAA